MTATTPETLMPRTLLAVAALSALASLSPCASADDPPASPAPSPREAAKKVLASLPEPSAAAAFSVEVDVWAAGHVQGTGSFSAAVVTVDGKSAWETKQALALGPAGDPQRVVTTTGTLAADLRVLKEVRSAKAADEPETTTTLEREEGGYDVTVRAGEGEPETKRVVAEGDVVATGPAATILLVSQGPKEPATYEVSSWDADERAVVSRTLAVKGPVRLSNEDLDLDMDAFGALGTGGRNSIELFFSPADRSFLAGHLVEAGVWIVKKGLIPTRFDLSKPAGDAKEVGGRFALGILTGDLAVVEACFHWPTLYATAKAQGFKGGEETYRAQEMENTKKTLKNAAVPRAAKVAAKARDGATVTEGEGVSEVTLGEPISALKYAAKAFDGAWLIVRMGAPK